MSRRSRSRPRRAVAGRFCPSPEERVAFERMTQDEITAVHRTWGANAEFDWPKLASGCTDIIGVVRKDDTVAAMCAVTHPVRGRGGSAFRLDFLEVAPAHRGQQLWGPLALAALASMARAANCTSMTLLALEEREQWYRRMGAVNAPDLHAEPGLVPLRFEVDALDALARKLDGSQEKAD